MYDAVSDFIVGTCQMFSDSSTAVIQSTYTPGLIAVQDTSLDILCGSSAEFFIRPLHPCIDDTDVMKTTLNFRAFKDKHLVVSYDDVHHFCDAVECLVMEPYANYPSFVRLRVFGETRYNWESRNFEFIRNNIGRLFTNQETRNIESESVECIEVGPAMRLKFQHGISLPPIDSINSIWCPQWPNEAKDWPIRRREYGWPTIDIIHQVVHNGCHVVHAKHSAWRNDEHQWRLSFSVSEIILLQSWTPIQQIVYHMLRFFAKRELITKDGPKHDEVLCAYHLKTLMLWSCEEMSPKWWNSTLVIKICSDLIKLLARWLKENTCRNYFIPEANLFRKRINLTKSTEISKKLFKFSCTDKLCFWFMRNYMEPVLLQVPKAREICEDVLSYIYQWFGEHYMQSNVLDVTSERQIREAACTQSALNRFSQCLIAIHEAMKAIAPKSIDLFISKVFWIVVQHSRWLNRTKSDSELFYLQNSKYSFRATIINECDRVQHLPCVLAESCFWFYGSMLRVLYAARLLDCKEVQFDSEWFVKRIRQISTKPNIFVSKYHTLPSKLNTGVNECQLHLIKAQYLMETLNGSTDDLEFQVISEVSERLLWKSLSCVESERDNINKATLSYVASLYFAKSEYQFVLDICSKVIMNEYCEKEDPETLNAGCLLYIEDISTIIGFYLIFRKLKHTHLLFYRRPVSLDLRLTPEIFAYFLTISSTERAGKVLRLNNISKHPTFPLDAILMKIANRKSSQLSHKGFRVLLAYKRTNQMNQLEACNKCRLPNEDHLIQMLMKFSLQNMTSCYNAICKHFRIDCSVVDGYHAAYLYKCCRYREMLDLCDKILHEPDQLESLREFRFANVTVLPPLDSFFDSDIQCVVGLYTLANYLPLIDDVVQKREVNNRSTFQLKCRYLFAQWIFNEKLSKHFEQLYASVHYVIGRHFLARYLKVRHLLETGCYSDALLDLEKLKSSLPFEHMMDVFLRKKLRRDDLI